MSNYPPNQHLGSQKLSGFDPLWWQRKVFTRNQRMVFQANGAIQYCIWGFIRNENMSSAPISPFGFIVRTTFFFPMEHYHTTIPLLRYAVEITWDFSKFFSQWKYTARLIPTEDHQIQLYQFRPGILQLQKTVTLSDYLTILTVTRLKKNRGWAEILSHLIPNFAGRWISIP